MLKNIGILSLIKTINSALGFLFIIIVAKVYGLEFRGELVKIMSWSAFFILFYISLQNVLFLPEFRNRNSFKTIYFYSFILFLFQFFITLIFVFFLKYDIQLLFASLLSFAIFYQYLKSNISQIQDRNIYYCLSIFVFKCALIISSLFSPYKDFNSFVILILVIYYLYFFADYFFDKKYSFFIMSYNFDLSILKKGFILSVSSVSSFLLADYVNIIFANRYDEFLLGKYDIYYQILAISLIPIQGVSVYYNSLYFKNKKKIPKIFKEAFYICLLIFGLTFFVFPVLNIVYKNYLDIESPSFDVLIRIYSNIFFMIFISVYGPFLIFLNKIKVSLIINLIAAISSFLFLNLFDYVMIYFDVRLLSSFLLFLGYLIFMIRHFTIKKNIS